MTESSNEIRIISICPKQVLYLSLAPRDHHSNSVKLDTLTDLHRLSDVEEAITIKN